jgi:hypothetical protein
VELPYAGGGPLRASVSVDHHALRTHEETVGAAVVYCHPWELDAEARSLPGTPRHVRLWKRLGRSRTLPTLRRLLGNFTFRSIREVYASELSS